jgi:hypothetical protein
LLLPFVLVVLAFFSWRRNAAGRYGRLTLVILSVTFLVAAWWFARNIWLYGDPIAANVTSAIAARRSFHLDTYLGGAWAEFRGLRWSFWGLFGWFSLLLPTPVYAVLDLLTVVALAGLVVAGWRARQHTERERQVAGRHLASGLWGGALVLLSVWLLVVFAGLVWWTTQTKGAHGRLLFPAISSLAVLLVAGWSAWLPGRLRAAMPVLVGVPLLVFAVWALAGVIQPAYARPPLVDVSAIPPAAQHSPIAFGQPDSGGRIRLLGVSVDPTDATPGETVRLTFYWQAMEPITRDTLLNVRLFGHDLALLVNEDTYPGWGSYPPSLWPVGPVVVDRYRFQLPAHVDAPTLVRVDVGFAERWTGDRWPAVDAQGQQLGDPVAVAAIRLHNATAGAELVGEPVAWLADGIILLNSQLVGAQPGKAGMDKLSLVAGDDVVVALEWTAEQAPSRDYTVFVHLLNHQGEIVTQADGPPRSGDFPTSAWRPGDRVPDRRLLTIPPNTPAGDYNLAAGMYEPDTLDRLPARDSANEPWPENAVRLRTVHLSQPTNVDTSP